VTPQELRRNKLAADYEEMRAIRGAVIHWEATHGQRPYFDQYFLRVRVRTIVGPGPDYADEVLLRLDLPPDYPFRSAPVIRVDPGPLPFHPNWFTSGHWCYGDWAPGDGLGFHVIRMVRTLQFEPGMTNLGSIANFEAASWWQSVQNRRYFPSDRQRLPDFTERRRISIRTVPRR